MTLGRIGDFDGKCPKCRIGEILDGIMAATQNRELSGRLEEMREALESGLDANLLDDMVEFTEEAQ